MAAGQGPMQNQAIRPCGERMMARAQLPEAHASSWHFPGEQAASELGAPNPARGQGAQRLVMPY